MTTATRTCEYPLCDGSLEDRRRDVRYCDRHCGRKHRNTVGMKPKTCLNPKCGADISHRYHNAKSCNRRCLNAYHRLQTSSPYVEVGIGPPTAGRNGNR